MHPGCFKIHGVSISFSPSLPAYIFFPLLVCSELLDTSHYSLVLSLSLSEPKLPFCPLAEERRKKRENRVKGLFFSSASFYPLLETIFCVGAEPAAVRSNGNMQWLTLKRLTKFVFQFRERLRKAFLFSFLLHL